MSFHIWFSEEPPAPTGSPCRTPPCWLASAEDSTRVIGWEVVEFTIHKERSYFCFPSIPSIPFLSSHAYELPYILELLSSRLPLLISFEASLTQRYASKRKPPKASSGSYLRCLLQDKVFKILDRGSRWWEGGFVKNPYVVFRVHTHIHVCVWFTYMHLLVCSQGIFNPALCESGKAPGRMSLACPLCSQQPLQHTGPSSFPFLSDVWRKCLWAFSFPSVRNFCVVNRTQLH